MNPYWLEEPTPARPETKLDGRADVAIVGAGVTGCSAARRLAQGGLRVRVHDARGIAEGASGRNGGFAMTMWSKFSSLKKLGATADAVWLARQAAESVSAIGAFCADHGIDASKRSVREPTENH